MKVQLPSRRVVVIEGKPEGPPPQPSRGPLFAAVFSLFAGTGPALRDEATGGPVAVSDIPLGDFHALRAIVTRLGWLDEEPVEITCRNCGALLRHRPCAELPLGPFVDRELDDPELDASLPLGAPHATALGVVVFAPRRAGEAKPLFRALARPSLRITAAVVRAMGLSRVGDATEPDAVAELLTRATDEQWSEITDLFLRTHYPPRLFSVAVCAQCGARNDVDAPYDREFEPFIQSENDRASNADSFVSFDEFDVAARRIAAGILSEPAARNVALVVDGDVPACDDGGEPLLGSYVPAFEGGGISPSKGAEITVYYRTFRAVWDEDGPYDWRGELEETIEHELEHHVAALRGDDPVDDEERAEIAREAARVVGRRAVVRAQVTELRDDVGSFVRRTWAVWLLLIIATVVAVLAESR